MTGLAWFYGLMSIATLSFIEVYGETWLRRWTRRMFYAALWPYAMYKVLSMPVGGRE